MNKLPKSSLTAMLMLFWAIPAAGASDSVGERVQLPSTVVPVHYELTIKPDAEKLTFDGTVRIDTEVVASASEIVLNALDLEIGKVVLDSAVGDVPRIIPDTVRQTVTFQFSEPIAPGRHVMTIDYRGKIYEKPQGLFVLNYDTPQGRERMLVTQFEAADARRFLPSWDEPARKASFALSVIAPEGRQVVSNMPVMAIDSLPDGANRTRFQHTPAMSSYLLFLGIGDLERLEKDVGGTKVSVVTKRGDSEKARFALDSAASLLGYFNDYFGTPYPLPKLDMIAAPGSGGFSAMENWGAILYFEHALLVDPRLSTESDRQRIFVVVAHEMAHQWFGNLVTMEWWDDLWLNEGFASWMETKATEHFHPEWRMWLQSEAARQRAMQQDARQTTHPIVQPVLNADQAGQAFDAITYNKGQAVIRMIEGFVGEDAFRQGVQAYMREFAYGNTVTHDFWAKLEASSAGKPVGDVARDFTTQPGVPLITAGSGGCSSDGGMRLTLSQGRFGVDAQSREPLRWHTPVAAAVVGSTLPPVELLVAGPDAMTLSLPVCAPVKINAGQTAYFRSAYAQPGFDALLKRLQTLPPADQLGLLYDSMALGEAGAAPLANYLGLTRTLQADADPVVWNQLANTLSTVNDHYAAFPERRAAFRAYAREILNPVFSRVGWDADPGEPNNVTTLRENLIDKLGRFDDEIVIAEARRRFEVFKKDPSSLPASIRRPTLQVVARKADAETYQTFRNLARSAISPLEKQQLYEVLATAEDPALASSSLEIAIGDEAQATTGLSMVRRVAMDNPDLAWRFALDHSNALDARLGPIERHGFYPSLAVASNNPDRLTDVRAFIDRTVPANARQSAERAYSELSFRLKVKADRLPEIDRWLAALESR
jgi:aminopeptidase N